MQSTLPKNLKVERYIVALVLSGRHDILDLLELEHFGDEEYRFMYRELRLMQEANVPLEPPGFTVWFGSRKVLQRAKSNQIDVIGLVASMLEDFVPTAHSEYYLNILNRERVRRGLLKTAVKLQELVESHPEDPCRILPWLRTQCNRLQDFVEDKMEEQV